MKKFEHMSLLDQIKFISTFVQIHNPDHHLVIENLLHLDKITNKTYVTLKSKIGNNVRTIQWRHLKYRGIKSPNNAMQPATLYLALFKNLQTKKIHPKFGNTTFVNYTERFHHASATWKFEEVIYERKGPLSEILSLEKKIDSIMCRYNMQQPNVVDFTWGGKTEVLKPFIEITSLYNHGWKQIIDVFSYKSIFSLD